MVFYIIQRSRFYLRRRATHENSLHLFVLNNIYKWCFIVDSLWKDTSIRRTPPYNGHLQLVPTFIPSFYLTLYNRAITQNFIFEILEVANNPNLNKNRGSTVRGDRWFELHVIEYQSRFNDRSLEFITIAVACTTIQCNSNIRGLVTTSQIAVVASSNTRSRQSNSRRSRRNKT